MNVRVLGLIAICLALALGAWLFTSYRQDRRIVESVPKIEEGAGAVVPVNPPSAPPGAAPQAAPSAAPPARPTEKPAAAGGASPPAANLPRPISPRAPAAGPSTSQPPVAVAPMDSPASAPVPKASGISPDVVAIDVDKVTLSLRDYRTITGENPIGTNAEITKALNGGNPKQARLLPEGQSLNANGELIDRWGHPYFFHQLSRTDMEIRSAGPDGVMWTEDDVIGH